MDRLLNYLMELANNLDQSGNIKCADAIDKLLKHKSVTKVAQYVGVIGYILKQNRAMGNCIRKKRVASNKSMQQVVLDCLKEYQDGQQYGNNDWTAKYAQVIKRVPEDFDSAHIAFIEAIAKENNITEHFNYIKEAHNLLTENNIEDQLLNAIVADINVLKSLEEGDAVHLPFKVAAPRSQRGLWSRFFSPQWSRRGKEKDIRLEMDNILDGIINISSNTQQFRNVALRLKQQVRALPEQYRRVILDVKSLLSNDWDQVIDSINDINRSIYTMPNNESFTEIRETLHELTNNIQKIYDNVAKIQRNMAYLRYRDIISGRGARQSLNEEYESLNIALSRVYQNPLDERSLYYSQKLHAKLENVIQEQITNKSDKSFQEQINQPALYTSDPDISSQGMQSQPVSATPLNDNKYERIAFAIVENIIQISEGNIDVLIRFRDALTDVVQGSGNVDALNIVREMLQEKIISLQSVRQKTKSSPEEEQGTDTLLGIEGYGNELGRPILLSELDQFDDKKEQVASRIATFIKLADIVDEIDPELADLIDDYIKKNTEKTYELPTFPENTPILKEKVIQAEKITI